jgi:hypothetical protein
MRRVCRKGGGKQLTEHRATSSNVNADGMGGKSGIGEAAMPVILPVLLSSRDDVEG